MTDSVLLFCASRIHCQLATASSRLRAAARPSRQSDATAAAPSSHASVAGASVGGAGRASPLVRSTRSMRRVSPLSCALDEVLTYAREGGVLREYTGGAQGVWRRRKKVAEGKQVAERGGGAHAYLRRRAHAELHVAAAVGAVLTYQPARVLGAEQLHIRLARGAAVGTEHQESAPKLEPPRGEEVAERQPRGRGRQPCHQQQRDGGGGGGSRRGRRRRGRLR
eukprot:scaffold98_cov64-Phaeocystis_antarctica.AAC.5